ncbi:MAG: YvcK family protein [Chloroflexi bacterium]|nr:MAG: YvcK family protein [Chloroflexota bacterium]
MELLKWLYPGMRVKRWVLLFLAGITALGLGIAYVLVDVYREQPLPPVFYYLTLQFLPRLGRALLLGIVGISLAVIGLVGLNRSLLSAFPQIPQERLVDAVYRRRARRRGPKIVAIGGGTGLSTLLRGLKEVTDNLTGVVTVADDGGSSGRLRRDMGVLPPGDFRQCIAALADAEPLMSQLLQYRFGNGDLGGHSFGNLFLVAMSEISGSFEEGLRQSSRVLAVRGRVVPSTLENVVLCAELANAAVVHGESQVPHGGAAVRRVFLEPADVRAYPEAVSAILDADLIVIGPGSLYTSVMPNLLVREIRAALQAAHAPVVYVCNVATQPGETDGYDVVDHVEALTRHIGPGLIDFVLVDSGPPPRFPPEWGVTPVWTGSNQVVGIPVISKDLRSSQRPTRHDPVKLAQAIVAVYEQYEITS